MRAIPVERRVPKSIILAALLAILFLLARPSWAEGTLVIQGGTLIDGTGRAPIKDAVVVVEGSRIKAAGPKASISMPSGATVIHAEGKTILPGLIDAHIHELDFFPPLFPYFGVTTVYDIANPTEWSIAQREALKSGKIKGPRLFVSGVVIDGPERAGEADRRENYLVHVHSPEEARAVARSLLREGVDILKVYQHLTPELLQAVVEEAHKAGTEAMGHSQDARVDAKVGLKFIEHSTPIAHSTITDPAKLKAIDDETARVPEADMDEALFDPLIDLLVKNGVYFNPTLTRIWINALPKKDQWYQEASQLLSRPDFGFIPEERREVWMKTISNEDDGRSPAQAERQKIGLKKVEEFTRKYAQAGGKIIAGPDSGPSSHPANMAGLAMHVEMEALVDVGLTPMQALMSATKWPAELLHKEKDLGTIEPGKLADLIVIEGDPLADIRTTRNIRTVILDGRVVDTKLDPGFQNPIPRTVAEYAMDSHEPELLAMTPEAADAGDPSLQIELRGKKFTPQSFVQFDTTPLQTKFVDPTRLTATVDGARLKNSGSYAVTVINPGSGGGVSRPVYFVVKFVK